jgi:hypothetical protein
MLDESPQSGLLKMLLLAVALVQARRRLRERLTTSPIISASGVTPLTTSPTFAPRPLGTRTRKRKEGREKLGLWLKPRSET